MRLEDYVARGEEAESIVQLLTPKLEALGAAEQASFAWRDDLGGVTRYLVACDLALFDFTLKIHERAVSRPFELSTNVIPWRGLEIRLRATDAGQYHPTAETHWTLSIPAIEVELTRDSRDAGPLLELWREAQRRVTGSLAEGAT